MESVYIVGKVTGLERDEVEKNFSRAEELLVSRFRRVVNPVKVVPVGTDWREAMRICIKALMDCDAVYVLNNYPTSRGSLLEIRIARELGMPIYYEGDL